MLQLLLNKFELWGKTFLGRALNYAFLSFQAFLEQIKNKGGDATPIIGQFGVGFYSAFMVADKVEVYTRSYKPGSPGLRWYSDG